MANKEKNVVLNFKMDGQVQYADTLKQINAVMNTAAKEYKNHIAAMGQDASMTDKLRAEKKKLEIQLDGSKKKTAMLRAEYEAMAKDTNTTTDQLNKMYGRLLDAESAEIKLQKSLERVNGGLTDQAQEARGAKDALSKLQDENKTLEAEQRKLTSAFKLQNAELDDHADESQKALLAQQQFADQAKLTERVIANLERQLNETKKVYGENSREVMQLETKLNSAKYTIKEFSRSLDGIEESSDGLENLGKKMDLNNLLEATELLQGMADSLMQVGQSAMQLGLSFGDSQTYIQANLGVTAEEAEKLNDVVEEVFKNGVVGSIEEAGQAVMLTKKAFGDLNNTDLEKLTDKIVTISKRTGTDVSENVRAAQKLMMEFGLTGEQAMDLIAQGYQNNLDKGGDFLDTINEYSPLFADAQFSADQMMNALKNGLDGGALNADKAADAIKELQIRFGDGSFKDNLDKFSGGTKDLFKQWQDGKATMAQVMESIKTDIQKMDSSEQQEALSALATQFEDLGVRGTVSILGISQGLEDATGKAEEMAQKSPGEEWEASLRELQSSMQPIGQNLLDALSPVVDVLVQISDWFSKLPAPVQTFITVFGGVIAIVLALTPVIIALTIAVGALEISLLPIIAVVLAVAAAIAGIVLVIQNWGAITDWFKDKWNKFTDNLPGPINRAKEKIEGIIDGIKGFFDKMKLKIPDIQIPKLPKFTIEGEFSLKPPSVPKIGIKWNAKGAIFTQPTIFGAYGGQLQGAGEASPEAAIPLNEETLGAIGRGIAETMKGNGNTYNFYPQKAVIDEQDVVRSMQRVELLYG